MSLDPSRHNLLPISEDPSEDAQQDHYDSPRHNRRCCSRRSGIVIFVVTVLSIVLITSSRSDYAKEALQKLKSTSSHSSDASEEVVNWSEFAYTQYATETDYLCNSVMLFETLHRLGSKPDRVLIYPKTMQIDDPPTTEEARLLSKARNEYRVILQPIDIVHVDNTDHTWADSFTKLLAFNQTQYRRVLNLDSDATVLQPMDELFQIPPAPVAMPRAYWDPGKGKQELSSQLILVQPTNEEFKRVQREIDHAGPEIYDMEIMNDLYDKSCIILPHRPYDLLTGEFRSKDHTHRNYLGNEYDKWNATDILREAKFLHFSDWPIPKPWIRPDPGALEREQPACLPREGSEEEDCTNRDAWRGFYDDFARRRKDVCGLDLRDQLRKVRRSAERRPPKHEPLF